MTSKASLSLVAKAIVTGDINTNRSALEKFMVRRTITRCLRKLIDNKMVYRVGAGRGVKVIYTDAFRKRVSRGYYDGR